MSARGSPQAASGTTTSSVSSWDPWCRVEETHSGAVVMLGDTAFKIKKPVDLGFLDFRDKAVRRRVCEREIELNQRLAPDVYRGIGELVDPAGEAEPAVVMRRMPEQLQLARLVRSGREVTRPVQQIARLVATFHAGARTGPEVIAQGTRDALRRRWAANLEQAQPFAGSLLDGGLLAEITLLAYRFLDGRDPLFEDRIRRGAVVDGHGDLTADDIYCLADGPRLLDCLEFDDTLRYVDRLDDVAFLAMGLEQLGAAQAAGVLVDTWAEHLGDPAPPSLVHHYVAYRAFVRAMVGCLRGAQHGWSHPPPRAYAETALAHLRAGSITLVLVGGAPGSGKTTLAGAIADRLGMVMLSSDRVRKESAGIDPTTSAAAPLGSGIYDAAHSRTTYERLRERAELLLRRGESVILDASWTRAAERDRARLLAERASADLVALTCEVDPTTAALRIRTRRGVSDADEIVAAAMRETFDPWPTGHPIDTSRSRDACIDQACTLVRPHPTPAATLMRRTRMEPG